MLCVFGIQVISKLPEAVQDQAEVKAVLELPGKVDPARKLEILRKEQKNIDAQRKAAEIAGEDVRQAAEIESLETLTDKAEILEPRSSEQRKFPYLTNKMVVCLR